MYLNWPLAFVHTTKLINCEYANIFFSLSVDIKEFLKNIKGLEIVNHMNAWKKCSCSKWRNIFWERLIKYFAWKIYLGQSTGGNCLGVGTWRAIILGYLSRGQLSRCQLSGFSLSGGHCLETIIWGQLPGGDYPGGSCPRIDQTIVTRKGKIIWKHEPNWRFYALMLRTKLY